MDRFVIRSPKAAAGTGRQQQQRVCRGQATLHSLKRVVVLEDIHRWRCVLELPNQTTENLVDTLSQLRKKIPSEEVIRSTGIGDAVQRLQGHQESAVSDLAQEVNTQWETFIREKRCKPSIEVRSDGATERLRSTGRTMLCRALEGADLLAEGIERELFLQSSRLTNVRYRRTLRTVVFALKNKPEIRSQVKDGGLAVTELVRRYKK